MTGTDIDFLRSHTFSTGRYDGPRHHRGRFTSVRENLVEGLRRAEESWSLRGSLCRSTTCLGTIGEGLRRPRNLGRRSTTSRNLGRFGTGLRRVGERWSLQGLLRGSHGRSTSGRRILVASEVALETSYRLGSPLTLLEHQGKLVTSSPWYPLYILIGQKLK